jgi:F-type H+-transporting ATPase subunit delta
MAYSRVAYRYVKSLIQLAVEQKVLDAVHNDMQLFNRVCRQNRALLVLLRNPVIRPGKKKDILMAIFRGKVHPLTLAFFDIVTRKNREEILPEIAQLFHQAYNEYQGIVSASLETAVQPDKNLIAEMEALVRKISRKNLVELITKVNPEMIGGFILKVNDRQIDASLLNRLKDMEREFTKNPYSKTY